jgi:hypothetical protein
MRKIFALLPLLILLLPTSSRAQEEVSFSTLEVNLWPEFDQPSMLVIYFATLSPQVSLPVEVTFKMPAGVDTPHAVAVGPSPGQVGDVFYNSVVSAGTTGISFTATAPYIQFEYYYSGIFGQDNQRHFEYRWAGDYAVDSFSLRVQQPVDTTDFRLSPATSNVLQAADGLWYHLMEVGALNAGDTFQVRLDYRKDSDSLTYQSLQIEPSGEIPISPSIPIGNQYLVWVLGVLGLLLIAGGGFWYWNSNRQVEQPRAKRRRRSASAEEVDDVEQGEPVYCHQCGKRAFGRDRFCRSCGVRLRKE